MIFVSGVVLLDTTQQPYLSMGVTASKSFIKVGDEMTVYYTGALVSTANGKIFIHISYDDNSEEGGFIPMKLEKDTFCATFKLLLPGIVKLSFKDGAGRWDDRSGLFYTFEVCKRSARPRKPDEAENSLESKE